jgi:type 1 glutamine amidotransferase
MTRRLAGLALLLTALTASAACVRHGTSLDMTGATWYHPRPVRDFAIDLDYRAADPKADAAILLRVDTTSAGSGYEVSLRQDPPGGPYERFQRMTGAITNVMAPHRLAARPAGEWNHVRVEAAGQRYRVYVNGELVTDFFGTRQREGLVGLRAPEGAAASFRNVRVTSVAAGPERLGDAFNAPPNAKPVRVLVVTATQGFRHTEAIDASREVLPELARTTEFRFDFSDTAGAITAENLARYDVLFLDNSTLRVAPADTSAAAVEASRTKGVKDPLTASQMAALDAFVRAGHGLVLAHSALDAGYGSAAYREMVGGGLFEMHPWVEPVRVVVEDRADPATRHFGPDVWIRDEIYVLDKSPRATSHVLLSLDKASAGAPNMTGGRPLPPNAAAQRPDHPTSWIRRHGQGRVFATVHGHFGDVWHRPDFLRHLLEGLRIAAGSAPADFATSAGR